MQSASRSMRSRGASAVEYIVVVVLVGLATVAGYHRLSSAYKCRVSAAIASLSGGSAPACGEGGAPSPPLALNDPPPGGADPCVNGKCMVTGQCFVAGTLVATEFGPLPIEHIIVGVRVMTRDEHGGDTLDWKPVLKTFQNHSRSLIRLTVVDATGSDEQLELTPSHRLYVQGRGWIDAESVVPGQDALVDSAGVSLPIVDAVSLPDQVPVFNLEVADYHTYFVGQHRLWAHNEVPASINTFWAGGDVPPSQLQNLVAWAQSAKDGGNKYTVTLWTTPDSLSPEQKKFLEEHGITVRTDTRDQISKNMRKYYDDAIKTKSWALASDIARYGFMPRNGGIYIDADMHPGNVDLSRDPPQLPNKNSPIFMPLFRDQASWDKATQEWMHKPGNENRQPTPKDVFDHLYGKRPQTYNNGFFITEKDPNSSFFNDLNTQILKQYDDEAERPGSNISYGSTCFGCIRTQPKITGTVKTDDAAYLTGPFPINMPSIQNNITKLQDDNWINNMTWITDGSTRDNGGGAGGASSNNEGCN